MSESSDNLPQRRRRSPGRRPLSEWSAEDTRREIRRHAVRLFNERSYMAVSIDDIARATGVTRATLYYHYKSKADIFVESVMAVMGFVREQVEAIVRQEHLSARERLALLVTTRSAMEGKPLPAPVDDINEGMMREAMTHLPPEHQAQLGAIMDELYGLTHSLMMAGIEKGEFKPLSPAILGFAFWQLFPTDGYPPHLGMKRAEIEAALLDIIFNGVCL